MWPSREHSSTTLAFLSPCLAFLSWQWVSHRVCLSEKLSGSAALTFYLNACSRAFHSFDAWMLTCFLLLIPLVLPHPLQLLCTACLLLLLIKTELPHYFNLSTKPYACTGYTLTCFTLQNTSKFLYRSQEHIWLIKDPIRL